MTLRGSKSGSTPAGLVDEQGWEDLVNDLGEPTDDEAGTEKESSAAVSKVSDLVSSVIKKLNISGSSSIGGSTNGDLETVQEDDDFDEDGRHRRELVTAKSALLWFDTPRDQAEQQGKVYLEQTQLGVYRSLLSDAYTSTGKTASSDASSWHVAAVTAVQAAPIRRPAAKGKSSGWKGKRLKGMDEAAGMLGVAFLEGEGYIPNLATKMDKQRQSLKSEEDEEGDQDSSDDGEVSSSSSESESEAASSTTASQISLPRTIDPPLRTWTVILFGGGHFSAVVVGLNPYIAPRAASRNRPLPEQGSDNEVLLEDRSLIVLAHKAFHRYTTRRKQGGSQSAQDASGKFAKSAGAQLRRYGEAALADEVRALLAMSGWRKLIGETEKVYIRANARAARGILWTWPGAASNEAHNASPLEGPRSDGRLRTIPFSTRNKATVGECLRVFAELSRVKIGRRTETELQEEDEAYRKSLAGSEAAREELKKRREKERAEREATIQKAREKAQKRKGEEAGLDKEEKKRRERFERMVEMVRRGRVDALVNHLAKHGSLLLLRNGWQLSDEKAEVSIDAPLPEWWRRQQLSSSAASGNAKKAATALIPSTMLQLAASAASEDTLQWLLVEKRADPTVGIARPPSSQDTSFESNDKTEAKPDWPHRTAYDLIPASAATAKASRNVFRKLSAQCPDWCDWVGVGIGSARVVDGPLTEEMESNQSRRKGNMREKAREREKKAKEAKENAPVAPAATPPPPPPSHETKNRLGGSGTAPRVVQAQKDRLEGVSPEMRMRIEREKRARAAEERMKKMKESS